MSYSTTEGQGMVAEFVIVGGGGYGCAVAYHLALRGHSVVVLEAEEIAAAASGGVGKRGVRANRRDLRELPLMREAYALWPNLADELGGDTGYVRTGSLSVIEKDVVGSRGGLVAAGSRAWTQSRFGVPTEVWTGEQVREAVPQISDDVRGALYAPLDGVAAQHATTLAYARAAKTRGASLHEGARVAELHPGRPGRRACVVTDDGRAYEAERGILLAANAGVPGLVSAGFGLELPAWTVYPQVVLLRPERPVELPHLLGHDSRVLSVKTLPDGVVQLSGGWRGRLDPATGGSEPVEEHVTGNIAQLEAVLPHAGRFERLSVHVASPECATVDQIPFIDPVPGADGFYLATGWTGHGWALLPAASRAIARMLLDGELPPELTPFSLTRLP